MITQQQFIDNLIILIRNAEDPESITNVMLADVLEFLNQGYKGALTDSSAIDTERSERKAADTLLKNSIESLRNTLLTVADTASQARSAAETNKTIIDSIIGGDASSAIDNFNEILDFLKGVEDTDTLIGKINEIRGKLTDLSYQHDVDLEVVLEEVNTTNSVVSSLEDRFLGVWDEVDTIKEMLAGVVSNEVPGLLKRLGYDDGDIQEFVWANIHLDLGITLEDLRRSAQLWENWDALKEFDGIAEKAGGFAVMPKCGDGVQVAKFWDDVYRVLYMDSRTGGILYMPFMDYGVNFARFLDVARSVRYISGSHDVKALCAGRDFDLVSESLRGIGRLQNCGVVNLKDCVSLRYIGTVECEQVSDGGFSGLPYVFDFSRVGVSGECVGDRLFYNFSGSPFPVFAEKSLPKATVLPSGLRVSQYNPVTKIPCSKAFMGRRVKDADLTVTRPAQSELFDHCWLEDCVVRVPEETGGHMLYTMYNCSAVGVSELHLPSATALDLRELYGYMRYRSDSDYRWECGRWDVYCPVARDVSAGSGDSSDTANADYKRRVLLWEVGGDDSQGIIVDYTNLWAVPVHDRIENEDELKRSMIESVKSWHDRTGKAAGYVYFSEAQYEWVFNLGIFNELDELFISKNYSVAIN